MLETLGFVSHVKLRVEKACLSNDLHDWPLHTLTKEHWNFTAWWGKMVCSGLEKSCSGTVKHWKKKEERRKKKEERRKKERKRKRKSSSHDILTSLHSVFASWPPTQYILSFYFQLLVSVKKIVSCSSKKCNHCDTLFQEGWLTTDISTSNLREMETLVISHHVQGST